MAYWQAREELNQAQAQQGHSNVVFLGDSITDGFVVLGRPFWDSYFAPLGAVDFAVGGYTTAQVLSQVLSGEVGALTPNVVVLNIGVNNLSGGQTPLQTLQGIISIVQWIQITSPGTQVVLTGILPAGQSGMNSIRPLIAQTNTLISQFAASAQLHYADFGPVFVAPNGDMLPGLTIDYVHPSVFGYALYTGGVYSSVTDALRENPPHRRRRLLRFRPWIIAHQVPHGREMRRLRPRGSRCLSFPVRVSGLPPCVGVDSF